MPWFILTMFDEYSLPDIPEVLIAPKPPLRFIVDVLFLHRYSMHGLRVENIQDFPLHNSSVSDNSALTAPK